MTGLRRAAAGPTIALSLRLVRAGGRKGATTLALSAAGFAVTACLLTVTVGALTGLLERTERTHWQTPAAATADEAVAVQRTRTSGVSGRPVTVVDLAALPARMPPAPPGLHAFPSPGEVWLSPALARATTDLPRRELADRFGRVTGVVGRAALGSPDDLLVVRGRRFDDPVMTSPVWSDQRRSYAFAGPIRVEGFHGMSAPDGLLQQYVPVAGVGTVLILVPLLVFVGAAARLGLSRREHQLATLRLAGATPAQVVAVTATGSALTALLGGLVGVALGVLAAPLAARTSLAGGTWFVADLVPGPLALTGLLLGVVALALLSSVGAARRASTSPLSVTARHTPRRLSPGRLALFALMLLAFVQYARSSTPSTTGVLLALAAVFAALGLVGPWLIGLLGRLLLARSSSTSVVLAGRRLLDDPRGTWRRVGAVAMTGFTAGIIALFPASSEAPAWGATDRLDVGVPAATSAASRDVVRRALESAGVDADITPTGLDRGALLTVSPTDGHAAYFGVRVDPGDEHTLEQVRTVVERTLPRAVTATGRDEIVTDALFVQDLRTGSILLLGVSFLIAMASATITSLSDVVDRRRTYRQLALIGMPLDVLNRARSIETVIPLVALALTATAAGIVVASPLTHLGLGASAGLDPSGVALLAGCLVTGVAGVAAAGALSRPLLARVAADPTSTAD